MTFQMWVAELIEQRFGTATALASEVGMKLSPFTRGVAAGTLNIENLLKLALVAEESPSKVLRLGRKGREADVIEQAYGPEKQVTDPLLQQLVKHWPSLTTDQKNFVRMTATAVLRERGADFDMVIEKADGSILAVELKPTRRVAGRKRGR